MGVVDEFVRQEGMQQRLDRGVGRGGIEQVQPLHVDHRLVGQRLERAQLSERFELHHRQAPRLDVGHTHPASVLSLVDQPDGEVLAREIYDGRMGIVPYIAPGFGLAKAAAAVFEQNPQAEGLILHKHGIFTFGEDAREAYERMIEMVSMAESRLRQGRRSSSRRGRSTAVPRKLHRSSAAPALKHEGAQPTRFITDFRTAGRAGLCQRGRACLLQPARRGDARPHHPHQEPAAGRAAAANGQARSVCCRHARCCGQVRRRVRCLFRPRERRRRQHQDQARRQPGVVLVPGAGCSASATPRRTPRSPPTSPDTVKVVTDAEAIGRYEPLPESDLFALEY